MLPSWPIDNEGVQAADYDSAGSGSVCRQGIAKGEVIMKFIKQSLSFILSCCLVLTTVPEGFAVQAEQSATQAPIQAVHETPGQLQQLVAPIALYPDALVAQVLAASTYPDQVVEADRWMQQHPELKGEQLGKEVDKQPWDPSVKALAEFPSVLANMDKNLSWTSSLGDAYVNQSDDVMKAVQEMRKRAKDSGNLKSTDQEKVSEKGHDIEIEPADPQVVYVPEYDPWLIYGGPLVAWPGWYWYPGLYLEGPGLAFGLGFGIGFFGGFGWGWGHWGWGRHGVEFDHRGWESHSRVFANRGFNGGRGGFNRGGGFHGGGGGEFHGGGSQHGFSGSHSGAFGGINHGGTTRGFSSRGQSSFGGGFHGGGGGFHGGGGGHGGGGHR